MNTQTFYNHREISFFRHNMYIKWRRQGSLCNGAYGYQWYPTPSDTGEKKKMAWRSMTSQILLGHQIHISERKTKRKLVLRRTVIWMTEAPALAMQTSYRVWSDTTRDATPFRSFFLFILRRCRCALGLLCLRRPTAPTDNTEEPPGILRNTASNFPHWSHVTVS